MTLIAKDLLLLLLDDEDGTGPSGVDLTPVLGGALLVELALDGAVRVGEKKRGFWAKAPVHVQPDAAPTDALLAQAVRLIGEKERSAEDLVGRLGKGLRDQLTARLAEQGVLRREESKVLGLFSRTTWPAADVAHERSLREALTGALVQGVSPDERTAALVSLLHAVGQAHQAVPHEGVPTREVKARAKAIADGDWAAKAVKDAVDAANAALVVGVGAAVAGGAVAGGS